MNEQVAGQNTAFRIVRIFPYSGRPFPLKFWTLPTSSTIRAQWIFSECPEFGRCSDTIVAMRVIGVALAFLAVSAFAKTPEPTNPWQVCFNDMDRVCPGTPKNEGSAIRCLMPNESKLSPACKTFFLARKREALKDWPCAEDADKLCKDAPNEVGAVGACLLKQRDKLSPKCREFHDQAAQKLREHQRKVEKSGKTVPPADAPPAGNRLPIPR